jgi:hypothetical protein
MEGSWKERSLPMVVPVMLCKRIEFYANMKRQDRKAGGSLYEGGHDAHTRQPILTIGNMATGNKKSTAKRKKALCPANWHNENSRFGESTS